MTISFLVISSLTTAKGSSSPRHSCTEVGERFGTASLGKLKMKRVGAIRTPEGPLEPGEYGKTFDSDTGHAQGNREAI